MQEKLMETIASAGMETIASAGMETIASAGMGNPPDYVKKWLMFGATNGPNGFKSINIIYVEKGHADEAEIELTRMFVPLLQLGNVELKTEVLGSMRDIMEIYRK